jgi:organic hydroperoxide reductase OsmC/OhrA
MATHVAEIKWAAKESPEEFLKGRFSRAHIVSFDGGTEVPASASPHVVGKWAVEAAVDPEEMLVASLSSCHMLSFLHLARLAGFVVRTYDDPAEGTTAEIAPGRLAMTR